MYKDNVFLAKNSLHKVLFYAPIAYTPYHFWYTHTLGFWKFLLQAKFEFRLIGPFSPPLIAFGLFNFSFQTFLSMPQDM